MKQYGIGVVIAALLAVATTAGAQTPGACLFDGTASIPAGLGLTPGQNVGFTFQGNLSDPAGGACGFPGPVKTGPSTIVVGNCAANVHMGPATTPVGNVDFQGVCAGAVCAGVAISTATDGAFEYTLVFDTTTVMNAVNQCPNNAFKKATFTGAAVGVGGL